LLEATLIRVGNDEYARQNQSFGLTTLRNHHARVEQHRIRFHFRGKSGVEHSVSVVDRRLAKVVKSCQELPGQELFQYLDENGEQRSVESADVNAYLRDIAGEDFSAKDFRTWAGTLLAVQELAALGPADSEAQARKNIVQAITSVASRLGNTPAVCRSCYVHPVVIEAYLEGRELPSIQPPGDRVRQGAMSDLDPWESAVIEMLRMQVTLKAAS
jgi:DNA topoisomerase-1